MNKESEQKTIQNQNRYLHRIDGTAKRKLATRKRPNQGVWFGLGMMGLVGWSIVIPTLLGAMFGIWLDKHYSGTISWTLTLLIIGLLIGCLNAWRWVDKEGEEMNRDQENSDE